MIPATREHLWLRHLASASPIPAFERWVNSAQGVMRMASSFSRLPWMPNKFHNLAPSKPH